MKIAASILAADFANLGRDIERAEAAGVDWIHVDVMDGRFVPNITIGPPVAAAIRKVTRLPLDAHLMIVEPDRYLAAFADAGVDRVTVHVEACIHLHRVVERIRELGMKPGIALNPASPVAGLEEILPYVDMVLAMTVNPGFGGQRFVPTSVGKLRRIRALCESSGVRDVELQVDGGIDAETIDAVAKAGATVAVAGSAVFRGAGSVEDRVAALRRALHGPGD